MVYLTRHAAPLLQTVGGRPHATVMDHEPDDRRASDSSDDDSDNDNDTSGLGQLRHKKPSRIRAPGRNRNTGSAVVPAKRAAEPEDELDSMIFSQSSSQSKRPLKTFGKKTFKARDKVIAQQEKTGCTY